MAKKRGVVKNLVTGLKAMGGALVHYLIMFVIVMLFAFIAGGLQQLGPVAIFFLGLLLFLTGIVVLGWVYNSFWGWK